ncbi:MAG: DUF3857 domain-containing protein [Sphingobacteriaceae bacterium]|nr:MAG: DUF3857 domain-containing protein [Sphingobacteriaceae bacterium]
MNRNLTFLGCCFYALFFCMINEASAQNTEIPKKYYQAATIPDSLKHEADAVVRYSSDEITVTAPGKATVLHHDITTILNEKGNRAATMILYYDKKFNSIRNAQMQVYNAEGKLLKKYNKSDMYDRSATDESTMITGYRLLALQHTPASYPITIESSYEKNLNSYLDLNSWDIQETGFAVENASYKVSVKPELGFHFKNKNISIKPVKQKEGDLDTYTWQVKNLSCITAEDNVPGWCVLPKISFATNSFAYNGMAGDISSWQNFGKWLQALNEDVNTLSPERAVELQNLTANFKNDKQKAEFLYHYLQQNTRYVSIQLGIGGLKPFPASFVDAKKYGDCKALVNYMHAMLKAVHIPSYYAVVRAGENEEAADRDFPASPFNHVILCVPFKTDTTWLECTSNTQPFGKLGTFTENRNALLITENGGKLVNTPKSSNADNQLNSEVLITLNADGSAKAKVNFTGSGHYREVFTEVLPRLKTNQQKEFLIRFFDFRQPSELVYQAVSDSAGINKINLDLEYEQFYEMSAGSKQFYKPRIFNLCGETMPTAEKRKSDYYFSCPMQKTCTTTIQLPEGFKLETVPTNVNLKFSYGDYQSTYVYDTASNKIISTVKFNLNTQIVPAGKYKDLQEYFAAIAKAQSKKIVVAHQL